MHRHDLEVMSSNPTWVEVAVLSTSVRVVLGPKLIRVLQQVGNQLNKRSSRLPVADRSMSHQDPAKTPRELPQSCLVNATTSSSRSSKTGSEIFGLNTNPQVVVPRGGT